MLLYFPRPWPYPQHKADSIFEATTIIRTEIKAGGTLIRGPAALLLATVSSIMTPMAMRSPHGIYSDEMPLYLLMIYLHIICRLEGNDKKGQGDKSIHRLYS
jgi:hypothetical protein